MIKDLKQASGVIEFTRTGSAFLISETKRIRKDIFIPKGKTGKALNGDSVFIKLNLKSDSSGEYTGEVVGIIKRFRTDYIGILEKAPNKEIYFVKSFSKKMPIEFFIPIENLNHAKVGEKVVVKLTRWHKSFHTPIGVIKQSLGMAGEHATEMNAILYENNIDSTFSDKVLKEAEDISFDIPQEEIDKREDFRNSIVFTIDPETAKDFDDALSYEQINEKRFRIGIHIADVGYYMKPGYDLDKEAYKRSTSTYLVDRCIPMLPERLSNGVCSLRPHEDKLAFSVIFTIQQEDYGFEIIKTEFKKTIINSGKRYSYEQAQEVIERIVKEDIEFDKFDLAVLKLDQIAKSFRAKRFQKGAVSFEKKEVRFKLDIDGTPIGVYFKESKDSNKLIEEFMLLANQTVAEYLGADQKRPCIYRTHALPVFEKLQELSIFVEQFGYKLELSESEELNKVALNKLLMEVKGSNHANIIETVAVRSMSKAIYTTEVLGHYGLGFKYYSHFTSPIRRYPDVILHRLLLNSLENKTSVFGSVLQTQCDHCSDLENKAAKAERDSIKFKQTEYMQNKIGEIFEGTVSGVTNWGLFVEIKENGCDGLINTDELFDLGFSLDEKNYKFIKENGSKIALGDTVNVKVNSVNLTKRQIDLSLI